MGNLYTLECRETLRSTFSFTNIKLAWCRTSEEFLPIRACFMLIASEVRALAWLKKKKEEEQNCVWAGCHFATLALLTGDFGNLVS